jgi:hypothetical protein
LAPIAVSQTIFNKIYMRLTSTDMYVGMAGFEPAASCSQSTSRPSPDGARAALVQVVRRGTLAMQGIGRHDSLVQVHAIEQRDDHRDLVRLGAFALYSAAPGRLSRGMSSRPAFRQ